MLREIFRRLIGKSAMPDWVKNGEISATGSELRYWRDTGFKKGATFYQGYFDLFQVSPDAFAGKTVADFGSGPFGGVLSSMPAVAQGYPIDVLAEEYNKIGQSPFPVISFDGKPTTVPAGSCDAVFCTNAIDHTPHPEWIINEILRILKPGGRAYMHLHLREPDELNKIHPFPWSADKFRNLFSGFEIEKLDIAYPDHVNGNDLHMLYATVIAPKGIN